MEGIRVRRLRERDIDRAIELTDLEHWGYTPADFRRLLALAPRGCFAAERKGRVVGVLSTTAYGPVAYLGAVIVEPAFRGRSVGEAMMREALEHLDASGVETVVLNAYLNVIPFYEKLGFRREYRNFRWEGARDGGPAPGIRPVRRADLNRVASFDAGYFGADRRRLLDRLASEFPGSFLLSESSGQIEGYIVGSAAPESCEIGPWVVAPGHPSAARDLFRSTLLATKARAYAFSAPMPNAEAQTFARELGLREVFQTLRMVRGREPFHGQPEGIWGFAGLEKG